VAAPADHCQLHAHIHRRELVFRLYQFAEIRRYQHGDLDLGRLAGGLRFLALSFPRRQASVLLAVVVALAHCIFNVPLAVWILEGFVSSVPREIDETAFLDGYSFPRFFIKILVPLIASGIGVAAFFCFMFSWVELLLARTLTSVAAKPISAVMTRTVSAAGMDWGLLAAAGVLTIIPGALVIWFVRNYIARGFALGRV
jgi:ABC-type glycerol-3-phosphate transport system permease component